MREKSCWLAFTIGVAAGASVALLYAPQSGAKTRKRLRRGMEDAGDYLEDAGDYLKAQAESLASEAQKLIKRTRSHADAVVDVAGDFVSDTMKSARDLL